VTNAQVADSGAYFAVLTNAAGATTSSVAVVQVGFPPTIVQEPVSRTNLAGSTAQFAVIASGTPAPAFQWFQNGLPLADDARHSGSTSTNLTISSVTNNDAGSYTVVVSNSFGTVPSAVATLTVWAPPRIVTQPISQSVVPGDTVSFSATASGSSPLYYQWHMEGLGLSNGGRVSGANSPTLTISGAQEDDAGNYSLLVTNAAGSATSSNAVLTVRPPPPCVAAPAGLVGWWRAEGDGADFASDNTAVLLNGVGFTNGRVGQALISMALTGG